MKKQQVLFVHSAGAQNAGEGSSALVAALRAGLGQEYIVRYPLMPNPGHPQYRTWKKQLTEELASAEDGVILVGHSLGGSVLVKYLSEEHYTMAVAGLFLVAAPYWGEPGWEIEEYTLQSNVAEALRPIPQIVLYHSRDDEVVPFSHSGTYARRIPQAVVRTLDGRGHEFRTGLPELVDDIKKMNVG